MQRIANGTQVASLPTRAAPVGTPGYGTNGDPGAGQLGSIFGADEFNPIQEELMSFLTAAGITPDADNYGQVLEAVQTLVGGGRLISSQKITATTTLTVPAGATKARVRMYGATGGGGGSAGAAGSVASPAGGAGYGEGDYAVTAGASITATIGAAGGGGAGGGSPTNGTAGGTTSFGSLMSITGSGPGIAANGAVQSSSGAGGVVTGATLRSVNGQAGGLGFDIGGGSAFILGQPGGAFGAAPSQVVATGSAVNGQGGQLGVGGGGGALSGGGGAGFRGEILVEFYT